jgi:hypothetical protein
MVRNSYFEATEGYKSNLLLEINVHVENLSIFLRSIGLKINELTLIKREPNDALFKLKKRSIFERSQSHGNIKTHFESQKTKDICLLSNKKYELLRESLSLENALASDTAMEPLRKKMADFFDIVPNNYGFYTNIPQKLGMAIRDFYIRNEKKVHKKQLIDNFRIRIAFDGTNITKNRIKNLNMTFTIINDEELAKSVKGNFALGINNI